MAQKYTISKIAIVDLIIEPPIQQQTGPFGRYRANKCGFDGGGSGGRCAGVRED